MQDKLELPQIKTINYMPSAENKGAQSLSPSRINQNKQIEQDQILYDLLQKKREQKSLKEKLKRRPLISSRLQVQKKGVLYVNTNRDLLKLDPVENQQTGQAMPAQNAQYIYKENSFSETSSEQSEDSVSKGHEFHQQAQKLMKEKDKNTVHSSSNYLQKSIYQQQEVKIIQVTKNQFTQQASSQGKFPRSSKDSLKSQNQLINYMNKSIRSGPDEFNFKKKIKFNDFASVINNDKELNEEFCFLNQGKHAYDWYIVSFDDINPRNYLTISGKGITYFNEGSTRFIKLDEWEKEKQLFSKIMQISFYQTYNIWRTFSMWKRHMRRTQMKECSKLLQQKLFILDPKMRQALFLIRDLSIDLSKVSFFDLSNKNFPMKIEEFKLVSDNYRKNVMQKQMSKIVQDIEDSLEEACNNSLLLFRKMNKLGSFGEEQQTQGQVKSSLIMQQQQKQQQNNQNVKYTQEATLKTHYRRLKKFVKFVDQLVLDQKLQMIKQASKQLLTIMFEMNKRKAAAEKKTGNQCWMIVEVVSKDEKIVYQPSKELCKQVFEEIIQKGVMDIKGFHRSFANQDNFQQFIGNLNQQEVPEQEEKEEYYQIDKIIVQNASYRRILDKFRMQLEYGYRNLVNFSNFLKTSLEIYKYHQEIELDQYRQMDALELAQIIETYQQHNEDLQSIEPIHATGLYLLDCTFLKQQIKDAALNSIQEYFKIIPQIMIERTDSLLYILSKHQSKVMFNPSKVEQFVTFLEDVRLLESEIESMALKCSNIQALQILVNSHKMPLDENKRKKVSDIQIQMSNIKKRLEEIVGNRDQSIERFKRELEKLIPLVHNKGRQIDENIKKFAQQTKTHDIEQIWIQLNDLYKKTLEIEEEKTNVQKYEQILQTQDKADFDILDNALKQFQLVYKLIEGKREWQNIYSKYLKTHFLDVNLNQVNLQSEKMHKMSQLCVRELEQNDIAILFKRDLEKFKEFFQVTELLNEPTLTELQWEQIRKLAIQENSNSELKKFHLKQESLFQDLRNKVYTVQFFIEIHVQKYEEQLKEIVIQAIKEAELSKMMAEVQNFWNQRISLTQYKEHKDVIILGNNEELITKLDDNLVVINNVLASKYVENIKGQVEYQFKQMSYLQELIDEWKLHQKNWMYLEPLLSTSYAQKNLGKDSKNFQSCDGNWKKFMRGVKDQPQLKRLADDFKMRSYYNFLHSNNVQFDGFQKALEDFLEKKREDFHRFFFLANDELLEMLSTIKTVQQLQPYLRKVFENISKLELDSKDNIIGMVSSEGEMIPLKSCVLRNDLEEQLLTLEEAMKAALKSVMRQALIKYDQEDTVIINWLLDNPCQAVTTIDAVFWTRITEDFLITSPKDIQDWFDSNNQGIEEIIQAIRGDLTDLQRATLTSMVTQDVHFRDIISIIIHNNIQSASDFLWVQQLRFYWEDDTPPILKQMQSSLTYGFEYLGVQQKIVITSMTERCWITITNALYMKLGANPQGPAGTGKTESVKELAKCIARYCVVFNCSDQINIKMMEKLFKGLCYTGSWTCLDEFNRIDIEVLSVIANQVDQIRKALLQGETTFTFSGKIISINHQLGIFITMNPSYLGRNTLPDNLKSLFRPVAMMVPDYAVISEIMLNSEGFLSAKDLSQKVVKLYKLASEQLSQQKHYDFGMRSIKSLLQMAGMIKRMRSELSEEDAIIQAMKDSNLSKLVKSDLVLFSAIITDLFPKVRLTPFINYELADTINQVIEGKHLTADQLFIDKIVNFSDNLSVRFGVILVGGTLTGKTTLINTLYETLNDLGELQGRYKKVHKVVMNPKSISMEELYGYYDNSTQQWLDGLLSKFLREFSQKEADENSWIVFDGPLDSLWVENMNTVLDDSITLCLSNGERIKLNKKIKLIFEVSDLTQTSPASVSRCGVIYFEKGSLSYKFLCDNYITTNYESFISPSQVQYLKQQLLCNIERIIEFVTNSCEMSFQISPNLIAFNILKTIQVLLRTYPQIIELGVKIETKDKDKQEKEKQKETAWKRIIDKMLMFGIFWSIVTLINQKSQEKFEKELVTSIFKLDRLIRGSLLNYNFIVSRNESEFLRWDLMNSVFEYKSSMPFYELVVSTKETLCYQWFIENFILDLSPLFLTGITGSGKTILINSVLKKLQEGGILSAFNITFSSQTQSISTQLLIEAKLTQQRRNKQHILLPPLGKKLAIFLDDFNMPSQDLYGAQPPLELLRHMQNYKGFYDRKTLLWKIVEGTALIAAAGPPGGGRSQVPERILRTFTVFNIQKPSEEHLQLIFGTILKAFFRKNKFSFEIIELAERNTIVNATLGLYNAVSNEFLPTPSKSHYTFNLRDVSKIVQGMLMTSSSTTFNLLNCTYLWIHEVCRVFKDRLVDEADSVKFTDQLIRQINQNFRVEIKKDEILKSSHPLLFVHNSTNQCYEQMKDYEKFVKIVELVMNEESKLSIVLFRYAIEHITRISRVLSQSRGNYMIIGLNGIGKRSIAQLASLFVQKQFCSFKMRTHYQHKDFRFDLATAIKEVGIYYNQTALYLSEPQIRSETFLEDINNLINSGEVPGLLTKEDNELIVRELSAQTLEESEPIKPIDLFTKKIRNNFHIVLAFSPVGEKLRNRMRQFPALINCCTIGWMDQWPEEALQSIAKIHMLKLKYEDATKEKRDKLVQLCVQCHISMEQQNIRFFKLNRRMVYTTPRNYINFLANFKIILDKKVQNTLVQRNKLLNGLEKLEQANELIETLKEEIIQLQPELQVKTEQTKNLIQILEVDRRKANSKREQVEKEEKQIQFQAEKNKNTKKEADRALATVEPLVQKAIDQLGTLSRNDISEVRNQPQTHQLVKFTMECVAVLLDEKTDWENVKKIMADPNFLPRMRGLNLKAISQNVKTLIKQRIESNPNFTPTTLKAINNAAKNICEWVRSVHNYFEINKQIAVKREEVKQKQQELEAANELLNQKRQELKDVIDKVAKLEEKFNLIRVEKEALDQKIQQCEQRIINAGELTIGLSQEKVNFTLNKPQIRWKESSEFLTKQVQFILGDVLLSSAYISYSGPYTGPFREVILTKWQQFCFEQEITYSVRTNIDKILSNPLETRIWNQNGLPSDFVSVSNAIILFMSRQYSLLIDPQLQATKWLIQTYKNLNFRTLKYQQKDFMKFVELNIKENNHLLVENVEETLDGQLDNLLNKEFRIDNQGKIEVEIGDAMVEIKEDFFIVFITVLPNPRFLPSIYIKTSVINFTVTQQGLEEQLLGEVVLKEMPDIEFEKQNLLQKISKGNVQLKQIEDKILQLLNESQGNILDDEELIQNLKISKITSNQVKESLLESEMKQQEIDISRQKLSPVAKRGSIIFFTMSDLSAIDFMYQFSLGYFKKLFSMIIEKSEKKDSIQERIQVLIENITKIIFQNVVRGLFNKDKTIFGFLLATNILKNEELINDKEWQFFLKGDFNLLKRNIQPPPKPGIHILTDNTWQIVFSMSLISESFNLVPKDMIKRPKEWEQWMQVSGLYAKELPLEKELSLFNQLLLVKVLKEQYTLEGMQQLVYKFLGKFFVSNENQLIEEVFEDTDEFTPLMILLSAGSDPLSQINRLVQYHKISQNKILNISLGQGQEKLAEDSIDQAKLEGSWVILQNCHLGKQFLTTLERKIEELSIPIPVAVKMPASSTSLQVIEGTPQSAKRSQRKITEEEPKEEDIQKRFRLIITTFPCDYFPPAVIQNSIKITNEAPKGLKSQMLKFYQEMDNQFLEHQHYRTDWPKFVFSITFLHAIISERRKFGPLGWNNQYEFNESDLNTALISVKNLLGTYTDFLPWEALQYVTCKINYGGRITDMQDARLLECYIAKFLQKESLKDKYLFSQLQNYFQPKEGDKQHYLKVIKSFPDMEQPILFGLNENAIIAYNIKESRGAIETILITQPKEAVEKSTQSPQEIVKEICFQMIKDLPQKILKRDSEDPSIMITQRKGKEVNKLVAKFGQQLKGQISNAKSTKNEKKKVDPLSLLSAEENAQSIEQIPIQVFQQQENAKFNGLLQLIEDTLKQLLKAIKGEIVMSQDLDRTYLSLLNNQVPTVWSSKSYPSLKSLASWMQDFIQRIDFFQAWMQEPPLTYWFPAFIFPQGFLTSVLQQYCRRYQLPIDKVKFTFLFKSKENLKGIPEEGVYIEGLFMESCKFNLKEYHLEDCAQGVMFNNSPIIHFQPNDLKYEIQHQFQTHSIPLYKTGIREGELLSTGHSTNFIINIDTPTKQTSDYWIFRGAAYFCSIEK